MPRNARSIVLLGTVLFLSGCIEQVGVPLPTPVLSVGGPRAIVQRIEDRAARETDQGTLLAVFLGARARFSVLVVMGELNLAWTPAMELGGIRSESGFLVLPMLGIRIVQ